MSRLFVLACFALLAVAVGGVLLHAPPTVPIGLFLLGIGSGIVIRVWVRNRRV